MSRLVRSLFGVALLALILVAGASSRTSDDESTPPTLLSPANGAAFSTGTALVFQIRTFAGDDPGGLWLQISRSSTTDEKGVIDKDVELEQFEATSDPAVFEATPVHYKGDWMDTPGTYYWQAYRISYANGADGRIESEIRSFTIKNPAPKKLAAARLEGAFRVKLRVRVTRGISTVKRGRTYTESWSFTPRCAGGPCRTRASVSSYSSAVGGWTLVLKRSGAVYKKSARATLLRCSSTRVRGPLTINVRVTKGAWIDGKWRATRVTGSFKHSVGAVRSGIYYCRAGMVRATLIGTLVT